MVNRNGFLSIGIIVFIGGLIVLSAGAGIYFYGRSRTEVPPAPALQTVAAPENENLFLEIESQLQMALKSGGITPEKYKLLDGQIQKLESDGADPGKIKALRVDLAKLEIGGATEPKATVAPTPQITPALTPAPPPPPPAPKANNATGYSFTIIGLVHDLTNAPAMTSGIPMAGLAVRALGAASASAVTKSNGSYTLSFTNAPTGTYDVCVSIPSGYTRNPPSECEQVIVARSLLYDKTLEFTTGGHSALNGTVVNFSLIRLEAADPSLAMLEPPLKLKSIGINLDYYNPATGKAGDLVFTKNKVMFDVLFTEFGFVIPGNMSATGADKTSPQPTFLAPLGTKVVSLVDGIVVGVPVLYSNDYSIMVAPDSNSNWRYETEHVVNPLVKVGDTVKAGQIIAEVSPHNKDGSSGYGMVEIGILRGGNPPQHICPFAYLDDSVKSDVQSKLKALYTSWEEYRGNNSLYNESAQPTPGCLTLQPIDG